MAVPSDGQPDTGRRLTTSEKEDYEKKLEESTRTRVGEGELVCHLGLTLVASKGSLRHLEAPTWARTIRSTLG